MTPITTGIHRDEKRWTLMNLTQPFLAILPVPQHYTQTLEFSIGLGISSISHCKHFIVHGSRSCHPNQDAVTYSAAYHSPHHRL